MGFEIVDPGFPKVITPDSFEWGAEVELLATIVDDPDVFRKVASDDIRHQWGTIEPIKDHTLIHLIALGDFEKTGSNRNGDAFEEWFTRKVHPTFVKYAKLYHNHKTKDPLNPSADLSKGHVVKSAHNDFQGRTELIIAAEHSKNASWLGDYERGEPAAFSMGFNCFYDECSKCGHKAKKPANYCEHVKKNASAPYGMNKILSDGSKCHVFNRSGYFNDISKVGTGADMIAFDLQKVASFAEANDQVVSGAESGHLYIKNINEPTGRMKIASEMIHWEEKMKQNSYPCFGAVSPRGLHPKTAGFINNASNSVGDLFAYFSERGIMLPVSDFFKVAMPDEYSSMAEDIEAIQSVLTVEGGMSWARDNGHLMNICENDSYDSSKKASSVKLPTGLDAIVVKDMSLRSEFARQRETETTVKVASIISNKEVVLTPKQASLACEYLAYQISAMEDLKDSLGENTIQTIVLG
jgi:hypothetical protein